MRTQGEWVVQSWERRDSDGSAITNGYEVVAKQVERDVTIYALTVEDEDCSDLWLISAAPDMLAALELMIAIHDEPSGFSGKYDKALDDAIQAQKEKIDERLLAARKAITKAKGGAA